MAALGWLLNLDFAASGVSATRRRHILIYCMASAALSAPMLLVLLNLLLGR